MPDHPQRVWFTAWRRAQPQGEARPGARVFVPSTAPETGDVERDDDGWPVQQPESDAAWLKRTVEELTTARPVEVTQAGRDFLVTAAGKVSSFNQSVTDRDAGFIASQLRYGGWPLRRNARPVEPAADPIEALSKRVEAVAGDLSTLAGLADDRFKAAEKRLDELELQGRVLKTAILDTRYGGLRDERAYQWFARIEREERAK